VSTLAHLVAELADRIGVTDPDEVRGRGARITTANQLSMNPEAIKSRHRAERRKAEREDDAA
jgi:hypothetical protein